MGNVCVKAENSGALEVPEYDKNGNKVRGKGKSAAQYQSKGIEKLENQIQDREAARQHLSASIQTNDNSALNNSYKEP